MKKAIICIFAIIMLLQFAACGAVKQAYEGFGFMGTYYSVQAIGGLSQKKFEQKLSEIEKCISTEQGELAVLNQAAKGETLYFSESAYGLIAYARAFEQNPLTHGVVDATVYPLVKLWGFGAGFSALSQLTPPHASEISAALALRGFEYFDFDDSARSVTKLQMGAGLDLGAFGKGYAVQILASEFGKSQAIVNLGGTVAAVNADYLIGIEPPFEDGGSYFATFTLRSGSYCSTAGSYQRYYEYNGQCYHHILGQDGYPAQSELRAVTVVADCGQLADALSTCCFILGYNNSLPLLQSVGAGAVFVYPDKTVKTYNLQIELKESDYILQ